MDFACQFPDLVVTPQFPLRPEHRELVPIEASLSLTQAVYLPNLVKPAVIEQFAPN